MSSDAPSERPRVAKHRKRGTKAADNFLSDRGPGNTSGQADKVGGKSRDEARRDLDELRSAFRPPKPDSLKVRLRKMLHPPYIPFTSLLLAVLSFALVLAYAESWGRGQSRTIHSQQAPGLAERSGVTGESVARQNGVTLRMTPAAFKKDEILYHVLTGPFPSRSLAEETCAEFTAAKQDCMVVKR